LTLLYSLSIHTDKRPTTRRDDVPDSGRLLIFHIALLTETTAAMRALVLDDKYRALVLDDKYRATIMLLVVGATAA
jgi:hypothetical protein